MSVNDKREKSVSHAEDIVQKAASQYFGKEVSSWLKIPGKVCKAAQTEFVNLGVRHIYEDFNFIMQDGQWYHFEFESDRVTRADLKRFREYEATTSKVHDVDVVTYIICSDAGQDVLDELQTGINTYRVKIVRLKDYDADRILEEVKKKENDVVTCDDLIPIAMCPLMSGKTTMKERIVEGFQILKQTYTKIETERQKCLQAILYVLALKFLTKAEMDEIKEVVDISYLGRLIYDDGFNAGVKQGIEQGIQQGHSRGIELGVEWCIIALIRSDIAEGRTKEIICSKLKAVFNLDDERMETYWRKSLASC